MTNFDKLIFAPRWVKICKETMVDFTAEKVVVLGFNKGCFSILSFPEYVFDAADLTALRHRGTSSYFMLFHQFDELYEDVFGVSFVAECDELDLGGKHGFIRNGIGLRKEFFFGGKVKTFLIQDELDLVALSKLESILWR